MMRSQWQSTAWFLTMLALAAAPVFAQPDDSGGNGAVTRTVTTVDGWRLPLDYYHPASEDTSPAKTQNTPSIILLHGTGGTRLVWKDLAMQLQRAGFAVVAIDLRKHGESRPPAGYRGSITRVAPVDYAAMAGADLPAVKTFLLSEHQEKRINIRKTAIIAAERMVPVAMTFAVADWMRPPYPDAPTLAARTPRGQDIRAIAMLSPSSNAGQLNVNDTARLLRNDAWMVAAWIGVGADDGNDDGTAETLYDRLGAGSPAAKEHVILSVFDKVKVRGTELLNIRGVNVERQLVSFMNDNIKILEDPWRTRVSRLE